MGVPTIALALSNTQEWLLDSFGAHVGRRIRALIDRRGWSLGTLADRSGVDKGHLSVLLRGKVPNPGSATLVRIARALGVELSEITGERPLPRRQIRISGGGAEVPVWQRRVHAGDDSPWQDTNDTVWVSGWLAEQRPNIAAAIVTGACIEPHVRQGEKVVFDPDQQPVDGEMVVVTTDEGETMVKWYVLDPSEGKLLIDAEDQAIKPNGAKIEGVVVSLERVPIRYRRRNQGG